MWRDRPPTDLHSPHTADPQAPVVVRFAAIGDIVLLTVLLHALAERYGRPVHVLSSGAWTPVLLGNDPAVGELRLLSSRRAPYWLTPSQWAARRWLRAHTGPVYLCDPDIYGARVIEGAAVPAERLVRAWDTWPGDTAHWADWWLQVAQLDAPGTPGPQRPLRSPARPELVSESAWRDRADRWLRDQGIEDQALVLIQPGHKKTHKRGRIATVAHDKHWPAAHWAAVIRGVLANLPEAAVMVCGSPREAGLVQEIVDTVGAATGPARVINVAAMQPTLERIAALAARAHSMISVDTGPAHVAGAMDCPLVVLYGQAGWGRWKPRAPTADVIALGPQAPTAAARLLDLDPAAVLAAWRQLRPRATLVTDAT